MNVFLALYITVTLLIKFILCERLGKGLPNKELFKNLQGNRINVNDLSSNVKQESCYLKEYIFLVLSENMSVCEEKQYSDTDFHKTLLSWKFDKDDSIISFPLDPIKENYIRRNVEGIIFSAVDPTPLEEPIRLAVYSEEVLEMLELDTSVTESKEFLGMVSGNWVHPTSLPFAHRYGGHQFGWWADQLGDGRAHLLGVFHRNDKRFELQLKGSGRTPYSRAGDGRAVIRSSVREFLAAEAMAALGFRTSRCLSLTTSNEMVPRDMFYNGNMKLEKAAVVLRVAESWFRFGSLEILSTKGEYDNLRLILDHIVEVHYPKIDIKSPDRYLQLFSIIVEETAEMIAQWQSIGFTHGVMNTDNMSLLSVTIDYGPFGFLDEYKPKYIPNSSDDDGLYRYENQPKIGYMNLQRLSSAFNSVLDESQKKQIMTILRGYDANFKKFYYNIMSKKLGIFINDESNLDLIDLFLTILKDTNSDYSNSFWELGNESMENLTARNFPDSFWSLPDISKSEKFKDFVEKYKSLLEKQEITEEQRRSSMKKINPRYILRNWIAQKAIEKAEYNDFHELRFIHKLLKNPFEINEEAEKKDYSKKPPKWSKKLKVSCSS